MTVIAITQHVPRPTGGVIIIASGWKNRGTR